MEEKQHLKTLMAVNFLEAVKNRFTEPGSSKYLKHNKKKRNVRVTDILLEPQNARRREMLNAVGEKGQIISKGMTERELTSQQPKQK